MKAWLMGFTLLAGAASAEAAEVWTCSSRDAGLLVRTRFVLSAPDLIDDHTNERYRIVQNDDRALVATRVNVDQEGAFAEVYAQTVVINKTTNEFGIAYFVPSHQEQHDQLPRRGNCLKN